ncbi:retinol-binding protein pinta-like isoform X2 [Photinus pyralis]|uniref:retinol-binding protein pinta-like isoform X2 n=1 Tax=Photinus pyralis TaxID=7054 RepID=UPI001266EC81|nr:retinol-binding protein pinta-like isoform X2 [Photinus pyralis]
MNVRLLPSNLQSYAIKECKEDPSRVPEDVAHIREWLTKQPHLKTRTDDQWILRFLRGCKFSLDKTKEKLNNFYTLRSALPEFFANRDPYLPKIQQILQLGAILPIDVPEGPKVLLHRTTNIDPSQVLLIDVIKVWSMIADIMLNEDDHGAIYGYRIIIDLDTLNANHLLQATPIVTKKITVISKDSIQSLCEHVPISALPVEYGGCGETLEELTVKWKHKVESYKEWFLEEATCGCDESKRISESYTPSDSFGINGSFRKLNID